MESVIERRVDAVPSAAVSDIEARWREYHTAATGYARRLVGPSDAEDVAAEAMARLLSRVAKDTTRIENTKAYLFTAVRNVASDHLKGRREYPSAEMERFDRPVDDASIREESQLLEQAVSALPASWRHALVAVEVQRLSNQEVALLLDSNPNAVAALTYRAREALRKAYLLAHLGEAGNDGCVATQRDLPAMARGTLAQFRVRRLRAHLEGCRECRLAGAEVAEIAALMPSLAGVRRSA